MLYSPKSKEILGLLPPENRTGILQDLLAMDHNSFTKPLSTAGFQQSAAVYTFVDNAPKAVWELRSDDSWPHFYLPIRGFREVDVGAPRPDSDRLQTSGLDAPALTFLSSGTTSLGKMRSKSLFSLQGAQNYRAASLAAFSDMLQLTLGRASEHVSGISLVPPKSSWPDSSLAQMIDWIKDFWKLTYMEQGDVEGLRRAIDLQSGEAQRPIFVFGTALHFHDLLNGGLTFKLPPGSLIIETGGTKGKTSYTTREELYDKLMLGFSCLQSQIVSEYGMCELASQAYDFLALGEQRDLADRRFRFPNWSPVRVMAKPEDADIIGVGALTVWDLARTDVPIPIQTEDLVELFADGTFKLLGRVEHSPLKGCSLNVTEVVSGTRSPEKPHKVQNADPDATAPLALISLEEIKIGLAERSEKSLSWLLNLSKDPVFLERLSLELGSKNLAESALADFHSGLPKTAVVLGESAIRSLGSQKTLPLKWLVIPPSTHSVASIHVLAICFALGLDIDARDTNIIGALSLGSALSQALATAKRQKLIAKIHPGIWRLSPNISETRSFLVFGDNETVATLSKMTRGKTIGFENALACTWSTSADLKEPQALRQLVKDNVALAQRGCMSARMNFIEGPLDIKTFERIQELIVESLSDYSVTQESTGIKKHARSTARSLEVVRLRQLGALVGGDLGLASGRSGAGGWTTAIVSAPDDPSRFLSRLDLTFIFIINTKNTPHIPSPRDLPGLKLIAASNSLAPFKVLTKDPHIGKDATLPEIDQRIRLVKLGELNCPALTGLHLDRAIFADLHESRVK